MDNIHKLFSLKQNIEPMKLKQLKKLDDASIFTKFDTDNSQTISDKEISDQGYEGQLFDKVKKYLLQRFGPEKIYNPPTIEESATPQSWNWEPISQIYSQDYVKQNTWSVRTAEGVPIDSSLNFNNADGIFQLKYMNFDNETFKDIPKENLPEGWNAEQVIELGKNPGHNVRKMHKAGYTGKGITVAVIDMPGIIHSDIKSSLVAYENMNYAQGQQAHFHYGTADLLVGDEVGTAPDANLMYFAVGDTRHYSEDRLQALRRIIEINQHSEPNNRIRVVSMSWGYHPGDKEYEEYASLLKELWSQGVFIATADFTMVDESITGAIMPRNILSKKDQMGDPDNFSNYVANSDVPGYPERALFVNSGDRTVASARDTDTYRHDSDASTSWSVPILAGIYASTLQCAEENGVEFSPQIFWDYALETGIPINWENEDPTAETELAGKMIDAEALINYIIQKSK